MGLCLINADFYEFSKSVKYLRIGLQLFELFDLKVYHRGFTPRSANFFFSIGRFGPPPSSLPMGRKEVIFFCFKASELKFYLRPYLTLCDGY